ncbi:MAG: GGDEF domain-containing protein [Caulobacteraceae bacterium]|nr:GGDEF domain-containing protein [Caulobacteraceae bacterium]
MSGEVEAILRGPSAYSAARTAVELMEAAGVWPTALNFELWLHLVADPQGPLAQEIQRLLKAGETITEAISEDLAQAFLPKAKLHDQIRDTGDLLSQEMATVSRLIRTARQTSEDYGKQLAGANRELDVELDADGLRTIVRDLTLATSQAHTENKALEQRLADSTAEVGRLREHLLQVRRDAVTDGLTSLANRKSFDEELARANAEAEQTGGKLSLAVLDIDHFKRFNDTWGHQTGDQVLRYVAGVIGRAGAAPRFAARYGGEEFALIFVGETGPQVEKTLGDILGEIASRRLKRRSTGEDLGIVTVSAGFADRLPAETPGSLVDRADEALYASKREGRNRVTAAERCATAA